MLQQSGAGSSAQQCDVLVIGGGINGVGIANHAAQAGLKVWLVEQGDLAGATSSASSKLIHGGLRYLEQYAFRLVRESLAEREVLLGMAPHIIWPLQFILPHHQALRPAWLIRAGLFLYDHLGGRRRLPGSRLCSLRGNAFGAPLKPQFARGFSYADCWVDDARLVVANAQQAHSLGATIQTRTRLELAKPNDGGWLATLRDTTTGSWHTVQARALVNAAGPWAERVLGQQLGKQTRDAVRMVKGSHIVVPRLHAGDHAYILQHHDGRIAFVLPYEDAFSLIGTTDVPFDGDPANVHISADEVNYLCALVSEYFATPVTAADVCWSYAGVRPLYDDRSDSPSAVTRDYVLRVDKNGPPLLSVFGGKLTTYRQLALHALAELAPLLGVSASLPHPPTHLPGGELAASDWPTLASAYPWLPPQLGQRLLRTYGAKLHQLLGASSALPDLGQDFGAGLYEREVRYLVQHEWAMQADDVLWRRTKRGVHMTELERDAFAAWFAHHSANT